MTTPGGISGRYPEPSREDAPAVPAAESRAMRECLELAREAADSAAPVMFLGEKGSGKRYLARYLHSLSRRRSRPYRELSCSEIADGDISRLFYGKSAGDGAPARPGLLDEAGGGSVLLADMEQLSIGAQKELYGFLSGFDAFSGNGAGLRFGVRILSTIRVTEDARHLVFSEELLNVLTETLVRVPPLRERREDIPPLAQLTLKRATAELGRTPRKFSPGAMDFLLHHDFPGNVSELRRLVYRAVRWAQGGSIYREDFGLEDAANSLTEKKGKTEQLLPSLSELERRHINRVLNHTGWKRRAAAQILGITETLLNRKIKLYGFEQGG